MPFPLISIIWFLAAACIVGVLLWGLGQLPIDGTIKAIVRVVIIVFFVIWVIYFLAGMATTMPMVPYRR
jgi:hypothetical protein